MLLPVRYFFLFVLFFLQICIVAAQVPSEPKREFRAVWLATVGNIDWPAKPLAPSDTQKKELTDIIEFHHQSGINAVFFQIRPAADAFYAKSREPWSQWLTGKQGQAPSPLFDPLEVAIKEAHKRGMELHAWFNPYRATLSANETNLSPTHITRLKPEWFLTYGGTKLFNPGLPEVREYIVQVVLNVVDNYDIDGVHMDDYFYPYQIAGQKIKDSATFAKYNNGFTDIEDWRRNNVDLLIKTLTDSIHKHKPFMKFGISPFGIWKNSYRDPEGSDTHGGDSYYELYADTRKWVKNGWVDYINPQLYWPIGYGAADYAKLLNWWSLNTYDRHLYIGHGAYRVNEIRNAGFKQPGQIPEQIKLLRKNPRVQGSVFFSSKSLINNPLGVNDSLSDNYYKYPALPPQMLWLDSIAPNRPQELGYKVQKRSIILIWKAPLPSKDKDPVYGYVVYRFEGDEKVALDDPKNILHIQYDTTPYFEDATIERAKNYKYVVTAIDRLKNESYPSNVLAISTQ